ncbi:hypothetical protein [uncultured Tenacibaculum sp.]|uniref:hypothetical protein n=1 Tax=uncultured Tenacibaculum sp. TaxID=174713 RepID=UPI00261C6F00|nr:hypothetical protein [uncultured Tenacibaculum sp.]
MENREEQKTWEDIKNIWNNSSESKEINIQMSELLIELKEKTSQFEKDAIKKDIELIKGTMSQFEKNLMRSGLKFVRRILQKFKGN